MGRCNPIKISAPQEIIIVLSGQERGKEAENWERKGYGSYLGGQIPAIHCGQCCVYITGESWGTDHPLSKSISIGAMPALCLLV